MQKRALRVAKPPEPDPDITGVVEQLSLVAVQLLALAERLRSARVTSAQPDPALLLSPEEAAGVLGVGRSTIYRLMDSGDLRRVNIGRCTRIPRVDLDSYLDELLTKGA